VFASAALVDRRRQAGKPRASGRYQGVAMRYPGALICAAALSSSLLAQGAARRDGNWQINLEIDIPGLPQAMPPMSVMQCITKEQAKDPTKMIPQGAAGLSPDCKVLDMKTEGNRTSWSMKCEGQNAMSGSGEFTFSGETYTGSMKLEMDRGGQPMPMSVKYSAKRMGECTQ